MQYIDASPHRAGSAYFAVYRYLLGDYEPYIYKTDDYGKTWTRLTDGKNGIPADKPTRVVREDPDRAGLLYAGTEFGMYISFDNGGHWLTEVPREPTAWQLSYFNCLRKQIAIEFLEPGAIGWAARARRTRHAGPKVAKEARMLAQASRVLGWPRLIH